MGASEYQKDVAIVNGGSGFTQGRRI